MIIKKFIGKSEAEAVEAAKKELGEGIVIMNVKQVKPKGIFAIFKSKKTEVTVALEEEPVRVAKKEENTENLQAGLVSGLAETGNDKADKNHILNKQNSIEKKLDSLQILLENQLKQAEGMETEEKENVAETEEKAAGSTNEEAAPEDGEQEKFIRLLYNTMIENEVSEKYANQVLEEVEKSRKPNMPMDYLLANIYQKMILKFGKSEGIVPAQKGPKLVFFLGPTGVGKTTTIAKLASSYVVEEKKRVAILTADTYRIAAAEQLRTYAQILEVPFRVVYSTDEIAEAVDTFNDYDYIFVDTAGHSHQKEDLLQEMKKSLENISAKAEYQVFLVLSATTKYKDLLKIAENYKNITKYQLIFTKLDETTTVGNLLNIKMHVDTPIAYVTCGQNVPNDIEQFNPQKTVKQLLGGKA
ncbi:MAG: flagellar biosynthesis protein FlhF [Lachnospiraceae bacterium]|nr:flagellar biosynthesis protein FlhF [Lachnospiraceae bacterium]